MCPTSVEREHRWEFETAEGRRGIKYDLLFQRKGIFERH
jgi:hypothetical protein